MTLIALLSWPFIAIAIFNGVGHVRGVILSVLFGALLLPEGISYDLPGLPPYNKELAIVAGLILGVWLTKDATVTGRPVFHNFSNKLLLWLAGVFLATSVLTVLANREPLFYGPVRVPGLGIRDIITMTSHCLVFLVPYWMAQRYLTDTKHHAMLLKAFAVAGLIYSLPILFEIRMAPQLHVWVYGYFQHGWAQHVRGGQFRPIVFQPHGLWIGIFLMTSVMAAFVLLRQQVEPGRTRLQYILVGCYLAAVLAVSRNFGAVLLALMFVPLLWVLTPRMQVWVAAVAMSFFMIFPALRQAEIINMDRVAEWVGTFSAERQQSFQHRLDNEKLFLERAAEKPLTGWGIWARWRIRDEVTGEDVSTSDGRWMSVLGERGWIGYIAYFGLLTAPVFLLLRRRKRPLSQETAGLALILAPIVLYQVPNNTIGPMSLILAGALAGHVRRADVREGDEAEQTVEAQAKTVGYTRFPQGQAAGHRRTRAITARDGPPG